MLEATAPSVNALTLIASRSLAFYSSSIGIDFVSVYGLLRRISPHVRWFRRWCHTPRPRVGALTWLISDSLFQKIGFVFAWSCLVDFHNRLFIHLRNVNLLKLHLQPRNRKRSPQCPEFQRSVCKFEIAPGTAIWGSKFFNFSLNLRDLCTESGQTFQGSFSAVSKPNFASKYSSESSRWDLHNARLCTVFGPLSNLNFFVKNCWIFCWFFTKCCKICQNLLNFC